MKKNEVAVGKVYVVKVSNVLTEVRLDRESPYGGWDGTNIKTGRSVRVKTAARLRREVSAESLAGREDAQRNFAMGAQPVKSGNLAYDRAFAIEWKILSGSLPW